MKSLKSSLFYNIKHSNYDNTINILNKFEKHEIDNLRVKDYNIIETIAIINTKISEEYIDIIDHILCKYNYLITDRAFDISFIKKNNTLIDYLKYYDDNDSDLYCGICYSGRMKNLFVKNMCLCKNRVHLDCIIDNIKNDDMHCKICLMGYKINEKNKTNININIDVGLIYFPDNCIYPSLTNIGHYVIVTDIYNKFIYSIKFLQCDALKKLIHNCNAKIKSDIVSKLISNDIGDFVDNKYSLKYNMNPLYPFHLNTEKYKIIEDVITDMIRNEWIYI